MTGAAINFNSATVPPAKAFDPLPSGWQNCRITDSSMVPTSKPGGQMLKVECTVIDGPFAGRKVFDRLNLVNDNPTAVQIAYEQLSAICAATGVPVIQQSTAELHNIPLKVKVKYTAAGSTPEGKAYDAGNEVKGYDHINSDHPVNHAAIAGGVAGAPSGQPVWATPPAAAPTAAPVPAAMPAPAVAPPVAFTPPVAAQPWAAAPVAAPVAAPPPPFVPPAPIAAPVVPEFIMLPLAQGATRESFHANGWSDEAMIQQGYMAIAPTAAPPAPMAPPAPPAGVPGATAGAITPPWQR